MTIIIDDTDKRILNMLIDDARLSYRQIAHDLGLATGTAMKRVKRLEKDGVITKYTTKIDYAKIGYDLQMVIHIKLDKEEIGVYEQEIARHPNVYSIYDVSGNADAVIIAKFRSRQALNKFLQDLRSKPWIERTESSLLLTTVKEDGLKFNV